MNVIIFKHPGAKIVSLYENVHLFISRVNAIFHDLNKMDLKNNKLVNIS